MRKWRFAAALASAPVAFQAVHAQDVPAKLSADLATAFGAREYIQQVSLSPDGTKIAMLVPATHRGMALVVGDMTKGMVLKAILASTGNGDQIAGCHWSTDTRLICQIALRNGTGKSIVRYNRIVALNADGSGLKELSAKPTGEALGFLGYGGELIDWGANGNGAALLTRYYVPEMSTGTLVSNTRQGLGVELVDTNSAARKSIEPPKDGAAGYISDGEGSVRIMAVRPDTSSGYGGNRLIYSYRLQGDRSWKPLTTATIEGDRMTGFEPLAIDRAQNLVYGLENQAGHTALYSVSLDGSLTKKLVITRPDVDMDGLIAIGRQNRVVGASFVTDRRQTVFFDPGLKALQVSLSKALPGRAISFVDASADESKLILFAGSDVDPGNFYLFDKKTHALAIISPVRPDLAKVKLAAVKSVTYQAADGTQIPAYLTLPAGSDGKNLPAIVMPHGGPASRDEWGFDWLAQYFAARGYAVIQPEFRGSTGYGDTWYLKNGFQSWRTSIGDVNDAGRFLVKSGIADPKKLAIVGWSYGGYAALQSSVLDPDLFKAVVAVAPVTDLDALREEARDTYDFPQRDAQIGHGPWVTEGSPAKNAERIKAPVLLFHGDRDTNVAISESRLMADKLKTAGGKVELVEFKGLDHQLDDDTARTTLLSRADAFLRASMGL
ncbi:MAG TPA: S9 family peptidase [Sphingomonas sp.]|nr:S9 family peptidase [Sphingomonas sp.]